MLLRLFTIISLAFWIVFTQSAADNWKAPLPLLDIKMSIEDFQSKYMKKYMDYGERIYRTIVLERNKKFINDFNRQSGKTFTMGQNQFMDLTPEEFVSRFTGLIPSDVISRQFVSDKEELQALEEQNCYCKTENALKKIQLEARINKNKDQVDNKIQKHITNNKNVSKNVQIDIVNIAKLLDPKQQSRLQDVSSPNPELFSTTIRDIAVEKINNQIASKIDATGKALQSFTTGYLVPNISEIIDTSIISYLSQQKDTSGKTRNLATLTDVDWTNMTGPIRSQGKCGACFAFASVNVLEAANAIYLFGGLYMQLSVQQVLDCAVSNYNGCDGGLLEWGFSYLKTTGVTTNYRYPYTSGTTGVGSTCKNLTGDFKILSYQTLSNSCNNLRNQLQRKPVATAIKAKNMQFYKSGVYNGCLASDPFDHAVVIVAYNSTVGWKFKNTWGTTWGQNGYGWLSLNETKNCGICVSPVVPRIKSQPL